MTTATEITATVTTNCECESYDEETGTYSPADTCFDICWEDACEWVGEVIQDWLTARGIEEGEFVKIEANGLGWLRRSGYKLCRADVIELTGALFIDGDFTIEYKLSDDKLTARRYSHDEPTGSAVFEFEPVEVCHYSECFEIDGLALDGYQNTACEFHRELASVN
jgi:hypothetical protein